MDFAAQAIRYATRMGANVINCSWASAYTAGLDSALTYIRSHASVWFATGEEIVQHWLQSGATF